MRKSEKCPYCKTPLTETNSVFIKITRYDNRPDIIVKRKILCTKCWDDTHITLKGVRING